MKKQLTVNTLAFGNLKQRRKQYTILIIGIILAMVFSSSTLFFLYSSQETERAQHYKEYGYQDGLIHAEGNAEEIFQKAYDDGIVTDYGFAHIIGFGYTDEEEEIMGTAIAWLDENAKRLSNQLLIEGSFPEKEDEIVIEKNALLRLGIDAQIGDEITLQVKPQNGSDYLDAVEKTYKLVGIAVDKRNNILWNYQNSEMLPAAFVAQGTHTELGGKEMLTAYVIGTDDYEEKIWIDDETYYYNDSLSNIGLYLNNLSIEYQSEYSRFYRGWSYETITSILPGGVYYIVISIVLIFASCMAIVNSFNTNLKERKRQIGLLRAVGATRRQIIRIFGRESFFISLICTPISIAISYGIVRIGITLLNEEAVFTKSIWALALCAVVNVIVTMLAALIPLVFASRITPMQAIRNIEINRRMKTKKIKTQKQFNVPSHLAKRTAKLYKGGKIAVSVILSVTIIFSCLGFSVLGGLKDEIASYLDYDYKLYNMAAHHSGYDNGLMTGVSEVEKRDIYAYPYFSKVFSHKEIASMFEVDTIDDYFLCLDTKDIFRDWDVYSLDLTTEYFLDGYLDLNDEGYLKYKNSYGNGKDILAASLNSYDADAIKEIEKFLTAGEIDYDKLNAGEEIILVAPQSAKFGFNENDPYGNGFEIYYDDEEVPSDVVIGYEGDLPYSVGDKLKLSVVEYASDEDYMLDRENGDYSGYSKRTDSEVTVAAIVNPEIFYNIDDMYIGSNFAFLTTHAGMNVLCENAKYLEFQISVVDSVEIDDDIDEEITEFLRTYVDKYAGSLVSNYAWYREDVERTMQMYAAMISIIILGFVICGSIVNNALTASIRERKKDIGTLRAVGADMRVLVGSYIRQLLSMFTFGYGIGFGVSCIIILVYNIFSKLQNVATIPFNPWITIIFSALLFGICSFNLWSKIRKEMKNSIVDNIREL